MCDINGTLLPSEGSLLPSNLETCFYCPNQMVCLQGRCKWNVEYSKCWTPTTQGRTFFAFCIVVLGVFAVSWVIGWSCKDCGKFSTIRRHGVKTTADVTKVHDAEQSNMLDWYGYPRAVLKHYVDVTWTPWTNAEELQVLKLMNGRNWHVVNAMQWEYIAQELNAINEVHTEDGVAKTARTGNDCSNRMLLRNSRYFDCCCRFRWRKYRHRNSAGSGTFYRPSKQMTVRVRVPRVEWENMGLVLKVVYDPLIPADVFAASVIKNQNVPRILLVCLFGLTFLLLGGGIYLLMDLYNCTDKPDCCCQTHTDNVADCFDAAVRPLGTRNDTCDYDLGRQHVNTLCYSECSRNWMLLSTAAIIMSGMTVTMTMMTKPKGAAKPGDGVISRFCTFICGPGEFCAPEKPSYVCSST